MKSLLSLLILACPIFLFAQSCPSGLAGTYKVGPTGTYSSIQEALDSLKSKGLSQPVILELQTNYNSVVEAFPIKFPKIDCADSTKTVTLRPETGASSLVISGGNDSVLLDFNNAYWFIIDGRAGGSGTTKQLRLNNTNTNGSTIRLINDACFNSFRHLDIQGASTSYTVGTIKIAGTGLSRGNDSNRVDTCDIYDGISTPAVAINVQGTLDKPNTGLLINGCNIYNFFSSRQSYSNGFRMGGQTDSVVIVNNRFYQTVPRNFSGPGHVYFSCISIEAPFNGAFLIGNNHMGGSAPNNKMDLKGNFTFAAIKVANGNGEKLESLIQNNVIEYIRLENEEPVFHRMIELGCSAGCFIANNYQYNGNCIGNTVGSPSEDSSIIFKFKKIDEQSSRFAAIHAYHPSGKDSTKIKSNVVAGIHTYTSSGLAYINLYGIGVDLLPLGFATSVSQNIWVEDNIIGSLVRKNSIVNYTGGETYGLFIFRNNEPNSIITAARNKISNLTSTTATSRNAGGIIGIASTGGLRGSQSLVANQITHLSSKGPGGTGPITGIRDNHDGAQNAFNSIIGNTIYGLTAGEWPTSYSSAALGIIVDGSTNNASTSNLKILIARNSIHGLSVSPGSLISYVAGIFAAERTGGATIENNMIRLGTDSLGNLIDTVNCAYWGIADDGSSNDYIHNSVFIAGNRPSLGSNSYSACLDISYSSSFRSIRNNIFVNLRNAGTGNNFRHSAINLFGATAPVNLSMNNNLYYLAPTGNQFGIMSGINTTTNTFEEWKQATGKDSNSIFADPKFVNPIGNAHTGDLHVTLPSPIESAGSLSGTTILDFDGDTRANSSPVDIGADAGQFGTLEPTTNASNLQITNITGNSATISCTAGSGQKRLIVIRRDSAVRDLPVDGRSYNANPAFNQGANLGNATYVLSDSAISVNVIDLAPSTKYHVAVFEYNGAGQLTNYLTTGFLNGNFTTLVPTAVIDLQDPGFKVNLSPNPTNNNVWLSVNSDRFTNLKISVYSQTGALQFNISKKITAGQTQIPINEFSKLKPGAYVIQLQTDKSKGSTIVVKQ